MFVQRLSKSAQVAFYLTERPFLLASGYSTNTNSFRTNKSQTKYRYTYFRARDSNNPALQILARNVITRHS